MNCSNQAESAATVWNPAIVKIELMIETPQCIIDSTGSFAIPKLLEAARGRCRGLHFGPYDYSASCNIAAAEQRLDHPACDFARHVMQVSAADRGVFLSDGPSTILPIPRHRAAGWGHAQRRAKGRESRDRPSGDAPSFRSGAAFARARLLPGLGSASRPASHALRRGVCIFPEKPGFGCRAAAELYRQGRASNVGGRCFRRCRHRAGPAQFPAARRELRRIHRKGSGRVGPHHPGAARAVVSTKSWRTAARHNI